MNTSTIFTMAGMTAVGMLGLVLASRAVDDGIQIFGLTLFALAVFLDFWLINRHYDPVVAEVEADSD
jgi:hypothetical protein